jgi:hypothetical protein
MHPDQGMGVEFTQTTAEHRALLEKFLSRLTENPHTSPELLVEPEGLETDVAQTLRTASDAGDLYDPLLELFRNQAGLAADSFHAELRKQRGLTVAGAANGAS